MATDANGIIEYVVSQTSDLVMGFKQQDPPWWNDAIMFAHFTIQYKVPFTLHVVRHGELKYPPVVVACFFLLEIHCYISLLEGKCLYIE